MKNRIIATLTAAAMAIAALGSFAEDEVPFGWQIQARQAVMTIYAFNLGLLGAMAKGEMPYDAELATNASQNLVAAVNMKNGAMWPAGSGTDAPGLADVTDAKAAVWSNYPEVAKHHEELATAITKMAAVAGNSLKGVQGNIGGVGKACKGCHEDFRVPDED
jgi:cytochrome c556